MRDIRRPFLALLLGFLGVGVIAPEGPVRAGGGEDPPGAVTTPDQARQDPDLPGFLEGRIDKGEYLRMRHEAADEYRGLPFSPGKEGPVNPRANAIKMMEAQRQQKLKLDALTPMGLPPPNWEEIGPAPIPNGQTSTRSDPVSGRSTAIAVDPTDAAVVYVGTAQGGVYRSLDGGATWTAIFDTAESLAIGALALAPSDPTILYVGTGESHSSGDSFFGVGVYRIDAAKTTADLTGPINPDVTFDNGGTPVLTGAFTGRAISEILVHPTDPATIFVSTFTGVAGLGATAYEAATAVPPLGVLGVYRSTNATSATPAFQKLSLGFAAGARLFAGDPTSENSRISDLAFEPGEPNTLLVGVFGGPPQGGAFAEGGIWRSSDALAATPTFAQTQALGNGIRVEFAINKVGTDVTVIAATGESAVFTGSLCASGSGALRRSTDGGATWSARLPGGAPGFCGNQCSYDIAVAMDPDDANLVYVGGSANSTCSRVYVRSTDGGDSFVFSDDGLHADSHALAVAPSNPSVVYIGNDGGVWKSTDSAATWTSLNNAGFSATQFQSLSLHPVDREFMIGGTQDNGTNFRRPDATWFRADFGDGGFALIDQSATDTENVTMYHTYFNQTNAMGYGRVSRAVDAVEGNWEFFGCGFVAGTNGLNCSPAASAILFYAPMALGPGTPNTLYFGSDRLFRSADRGETMALVSQGPIETGVAVSAIGVARLDDNVRLVGMRFGKVWATHDGSSTLVDVSGPWPTSASLAAQPRRFVSRVVIDPTNVNTAYVTFATYCASSGTPTANCAQVYKTTDLVTSLAAAGVPTWTAANNGIPDIPVNAFVVDPRDANRLFAGTDIGVYQSTDGGASWSPYGTGFPRVAVFDLALHAPSGTLRAATHGRGIWEIAVGDATPVFTGLATPVIGPGTASTLLYGFLKAGSLVPPGSVDVTVDGVTQSASVQAGTGFFSTTFATGSLGLGAYPILYSYAGAAGYAPAGGAGNLVVSGTFAPTTSIIDAPPAAYPNGAVTVTVSSPGGTPAGDVTLRVDGGEALTQALDGAGQATFSLPTVQVGTHDLLASYAAQGAFGASAATGSLTITKATPAFSVASPKIALGQTPSVLSGTLGVSGASPSGSVDITLDGVTQSADIAQGSFASSFATGALLTGVYPITFSYAGDANFEPANGAGTLTVTPAFVTSTLSNTAAITISDAAPASPSPSVINVSGLSGSVLEATVTLKGVSHTWFGDTAFLLVGPGGATTTLFYHVGGASPGLTGQDITVDDGGASPPSAMVGGTYRPTQSSAVSDFRTGGLPGPNPPAAPYGTTLFAHNGQSPNGEWKLYVQDDFNGDTGALAGGFELTLVTTAPVGASIDDVTVAEGGDAVFTVTLSNPPPTAVDIDFTTAAGAATSGADFTAVAGTLHFDPFETSQTITVATLADALGEADETFVVNLSNPQGATLADAQGVGTIDDAQPHASVDDITAPEGNGGRTPFVFTVSLDVPPTSTLSLRYETAPVDASPNRDYTPTRGVLTFAPGQSTRTVSVPVFGDRTEEFDEGFLLRLSDATAGLFIDEDEALATIENDDVSGPPKVGVSDVSRVEGNSGASDLVFTLRLTRAASAEVTVSFTTANGTATAGTDYTAVSGSVVFPIGTTERTVAVPVLGDTTAEADETLFLNLRAGRSVRFLDRQGKGTIVDDEP